jgi:hypothetical protein
VSDHSHYRRLAEIEQGRTTMTTEKDFETTLTVFMLTKTTTAWLGLSVEKRFAYFNETIEPILERHANGVAMRFFDTEFYSARVTDIWVWDAKDHHSYQMLIEELRETAMWDHYFAVVEILPGVENAYADNYGRAPLAA